MVMIWVRLIRKGEKTINDVPQRYRAEVQRILDEE